VTSAAEPVRVVGVAVIGHGKGGPRVLAARRTSPPSAAGGWELPGGQCEPGEELEQAAVREVEEELGCRVRVTGRLAGVQPIVDGLTLEVVTAELVSGVPVPTEHDAVRWLTAAELGDVRWLAADVPFLGELGDVLRDGSPEF
jgi:8-oxo-dGTP diphosphatase